MASEATSASAAKLSVAEIYRRSKKKNDPFWNEWVSRPIAAIFVYILRDTRITPNQVTFLSLLCALICDIELVVIRSHVGLIVGALLLQLAFVLDCTDGQLARIRVTASPLGGYLDFLMDEIKAVALIVAMALRLTLGALEEENTASAIGWSILGLVGCACAASGISLTTFMRRPEYIAFVRGESLPSLPVLVDPGDMPLAPSVPRRSLLGRIVALAESGGRFVVNYPGWFWAPALLGKAEWFLVPYLVAHGLYLVRAGLQVAWRLGR